MLINNVDDAIYLKTKKRKLINMNNEIVEIAKYINEAEEYQNKLSTNTLNDEDYLKLVAIRSDLDSFNKTIKAHSNYSLSLDNTLKTLDSVLMNYCNEKEKEYINKYHNKK